MDLVKEVPDSRKYRAKLRFSVIVAAGVPTFAFAVLVQERKYVIAGLVGIALVLLSLLEFVVADLLVDRRFPRETERFLNRLKERIAATSTHDELVEAVQVCIETFKGCNVESVSGTIHFRVTHYDEANKQAPALVQLAPYTGQGGEPWRVIAATKGIVGRCLRLERKVWVNFADASEYEDRMVQEFGFTAEQSARHTRSARSYLAYPVRDAVGSLVALLYFFSTEPQVFPLAADDSELRRTSEEVVRLLRAAEILASPGPNAGGSVA